MPLNKSEARVLIVDDTPKNIQVLGSILKNEGYQINVAQNGLQALASVKKVKPDIILLDVMMPELDGFGTCKQLKASRETEYIPVIFLTAKTEIEDIVEGFELGAVDYVTKPFNHAELLKRVESHIELKLSREKIESQAQELQEWNENLEEKLDQRTREINKMNNELKQKNIVLEARDKIIQFILEVHDIEENLEFIFKEILIITSINQVVLYALPENGRFPTYFGLKLDRGKITKLPKKELEKFPALPVLEADKINKKMKSGISKDNEINEYSSFVPLVKEDVNLGFVVMNNSFIKKEIDEFDKMIVADFASLVSIVLNDFVITNSSEKLDESIQNILKDY